MSRTRPAMQEKKCKVELEGFAEVPGRIYLCVRGLPGARWAAAQQVQGYRVETVTKRESLKKVAISPDIMISGSFLCL